MHAERLLPGGPGPFCLQGHFAPPNAGLESKTTCSSDALEVRHASSKTHPNPYTGLLLGIEVSGIPSPSLGQPSVPPHTCGSVRGGWRLPG